VGNLLKDFAVVRTPGREKIVFHRSSYKTLIRNPESQARNYQDKAQDRPKQYQSLKQSKNEIIKT
jgi:hypothetical protein